MRGTPYRDPHYGAVAYCSDEYVPAPASSYMYPPGGIYAPYPFGFEGSPGRHMLHQGAMQSPHQQRTLSVNASSCKKKRMSCSDHKRGSGDKHTAAYPVTHRSRVRNPDIHPRQLNFND